MKRQIKNAIVWTAVATIAFTLSACNANQGLVIDEVTGKPIAGAQI